MKLSIFTIGNFIRKSQNSLHEYFICYFISHEKELSLPEGVLGFQIGTNFYLNQIY